MLAASLRLKKLPFSKQLDDSNGSVPTDSVATVAPSEDHGPEEQNNENAINEAARNETSCSRGYVAGLRSSIFGLHIHGTC